MREDARGLTLDATGEKLLALLAADARRPAASLARELGISRPAVQERIARMEASGLIGGYTVVRGTAWRDDDQVALVSVRIAVRPCGPVLRRLRAHSAVERVFSTAGDVDAVLLVRATDPASLSRVGDELSAIEGVGRIEMRNVLGEL